LIEGKPPQVLYSHSTWYLPGACISAFFKLIFLFFVRFHLDSDLNKKKESFFGMRHAGGLRCGVPFILFFRFDVYWPLEAMKTVENDWCHLFGLSVLNLKHFSFLFGFSSNIVRCYVSPPVAFSFVFFPRTSWRWRNIITTWTFYSYFSGPSLSLSLSFGQDYVCMWQERRSFSHISHKEVISRGGRIEKLETKKKKELTGKWKMVSFHLFKRPVSTTDKKGLKAWNSFLCFCFLFFCVSHLFSVGEEEATHTPLFSEWRLTKLCVAVDI
jgi:hypothetical protein